MMRQKLWADEVIEAIVNGEEISVGVQVTKIQVPPAMLTAARNAGEWGSRLLTGYEHQQLEASLEAALRWLSENPIVPTKKQLENLWYESQGKGPEGTIEHCIAEWQRRMFLAPEPEKAAIKQCPKCGCDVFLRETNRIIAHRIYGKRCEASECDYGSFFTPEPEVPEAIKYMQRIHYESLLGYADPQAELDRHLLKLLTEAYRRGQKDK